MKKPIRKKLFFMYSIIFSIGFLGYNILLIYYMAGDINDRVILTQKQMRYNIVTNIENYLEDMNEFSLTLLNSESFKKNVITVLPQKYEDNQNYSGVLRDLYQIAHQIIPKQYKVGVYIYSDYYLWMGNDFIFESLKGENINPFIGYSSYGNMNVKRLSKNLLMENITDNPQRYETDNVISLARTINIKNYFTHPQAMLEVQVSGENFDKYIGDMLLNSNINNMQIGIFNREGEVLYNAEGIKIEEYMKDQTLVSQEIQTSEALIKIEPILESNVFVATVIPNVFYNLNVMQFLTYAIIGAAALMVGMYFITYLVSRKFSKPIQNLCGVVEKIDMKPESLKGLEKQSDILEIDLLRETICKLHGNLMTSMEEIVTLREYELQSVFLALQAQIQPHFLYNTLMNIAAIAENSDNKKIVQMCEALTNMLRFIASKEQDDNQLFHEIQYLKNYIDIMKVRFPDLEIEYDIPLELTMQYVPKLIVQPIVENAFKYAGVRPLSIKIHGYSTDDKWYLEISDNGNGFSQEVRKELMERFEKVVYEKGMLNGTIDGMGLINIYMRLKIIYKEETVFDIENKDGALIRIGGRVDGK